MADSTPSLSREQKEKFIRWLTQKTNGRTIACSICNTAKWNIGDDLVIPPVFKNQGTQLGGVGYPQVMLICHNCGHTVFMNAVIAGLTESIEEAERRIKEKEGSAPNSGEKGNG